jgi:hypothetical protein
VHNMTTRLPRRPTGIALRAMESPISTSGQCFWLCESRVNAPAHSSREHHSKLINLPLRILNVRGCS